MKVIEDIAVISNTGKQKIILSLARATWGEMLVLRRIQKSNHNEVDIFLSDEQALELAYAINNYFHVYD